MLAYRSHSVNRYGRTAELRTQLGPKERDIGLHRSPSFEADPCVGKVGIMKKGYWVVAYRSISDESAVAAYAALAGPAIKSLGGRALTGAASRVKAFEAGLLRRTIVVEFDSYETALAVRESEAYQKALEALGSGAERDFRIVEGF